jgi:hypothetical protein
MCGSKAEKIFSKQLVFGLQGWKIRAFHKKVFPDRRLPMKKTTSTGGRGGGKFLRLPFYRRSHAGRDCRPETRARRCSDPGRGGATPSGDQARAAHEARPNTGRWKKRPVWAFNPGRKDQIEDVESWRGIIKLLYILGITAKAQCP